MRSCARSQEGDWVGFKFRTTPRTKNTRKRPYFSVLIHSTWLNVQEHNGLLAEKGSGPEERKLSRKAQKIEEERKHTQEAERSRAAEVHAKNMMHAV